MIKPGEEWGGPESAVPDVEVVGDDADLASAVRDFPHALVRFTPTARSDVARAVGIEPASYGWEARGIAVPMDALALADGRLATNMIIVGTPPDRLRRFSRRFFAAVSVDDAVVAEGPATSVVIATGQFLRGLDVVPRGHPGDGRAEVQVYALRPAQRRAARVRLATGAHIPHPAITQRAGRRVEIRTREPVPYEIDGYEAAPSAQLEISVVPGAYRLLL